MRAHYLQHIPFEELGNIAPWLEASGYEITGTKLFDSAKYPNLKEIDLLVILGGPMSVNGKDEISWLASEKQFIHESINSGKPVMGICLGAQLIASALGASVYRNSVKAIEWFPIYGISSNNNSIFSFPPSVKVFHWHGETFDLPSGATRLAKSDVCENQAFQFGNSVIGLQFHLKTTPIAVCDIVAHCRSELVPSKYIQTEEEILSAKPRRYKLVIS